MRGAEMVVPVEIDVVIKNAPSAYNYLQGADALSLAKGDVVYFRTNISGSTVKDIDLIYRPTKIFKGSGSFSEFFTGGSVAQKASFGTKLPSERAYILGVVTDRRNGSLIVYPGSGSGEDAMDIAYTNDTVTYIYDLDSREDPYIANSSSISKSVIPKRAYDDDDNITFSDEYTYSVALVRTVDRTAVDIIVFENAEY